MSRQRQVRLWAAVVLVLVLLLLGLLAWPTPYIYRQHGRLLIRINRLTQNVNVHRNGRWLALRRPGEQEMLPDKRIKLETTELKQYDIPGAESFLKVRLFNGAAWPIYKIRVAIIAPDGKRYESGPQYLRVAPETWQDGLIMFGYLPRLPNTGWKAELMSAERDDPDSTEVPGL